MSYIQWQVRKAGKSYGPGMSENVELASPYPWDEYNGTNLPADFDGEVIRRVVKEGPAPADGYVPHISQKQHMEMYAGAN